MLFPGLFLYPNDLVKIGPGFYPLWIAPTGITGRVKMKKLLGVSIFVLAFFGISTALAKPPMGIQGNVTVLNDENNPVPVTVTNLPEAVAPKIRIPYSQSSVGNCNGFNCILDGFEIVPEGKLLVISHISVVVRPALTTTVVDQATLKTNNTIAPTFIVNYFPMPRIGQKGDGVLADTWAMNAPVTAFVTAGSFPSLSVTIRDEGVVSFSQASISGFLIDAD
jgi:hypothetical protein